jgi:hypothetical protein
MDSNFTFYVTLPNTMVLAVPWYWTLQCFAKVVIPLGNAFDSDYSCESAWVSLLELNTSGLYKITPFL